ncbi:MAG: DUF1902 domain-containing protein [Propionibacteriaceae bacterium]|jgi:predicted RNase H-like HicB family nuclease|nr:DUF1902 domain-containing protein [Propionibacteriaceae bacterium]
MTKYNIAMTWDVDAEVWTAQSPDIPGLVLESSSACALVERLRLAASELLESNGHPESEPVLPAHGLSAKITCERLNSESQGKFDAAVAMLHDGTDGMSLEEAFAQLDI